MKMKLDGALHIYEEFEYEFKFKMALSMKFKFEKWNLNKVYVNK